MWIVSVLLCGAKTKPSCWCSHSGLAWDHIFCAAVALAASWFILPPKHSSDRRPYLQRPEDISETNANQLRGWYENVSLVGKEWERSGVSRWIRGLCVVIRSFHWHLSHCCISAFVCVCLPDGLGGVDGKGACVNVCWHLRGSEAVCCARDEWHS